MKKDPNSTPGSPDFTLPKSKILRGRSNFQRLFERSTVLKSTSIHLRYRYYSDPAEGCLIGFIAGKKLGNAVTRNRIKRLLREAYRTHQYILSDLFDSKLFGFHGILVAQISDISFQTLKRELPQLLQQARDQLLKKGHITVKQANRNS